VIVGTGGVCDVGGVVEMLSAGADLVGVGFGVMADPELPQRLQRELSQWLDAHGFAAASEIAGAATRGGFDVH
jgi:dihydroorotate dehydrogenase (NAD+) catalytic subunit